MSFRRMSMKTQGLIPKWLVIAVFNLLCLWCNDCSLAAPVPLNDPSKPSREAIDSVTYKTALHWLDKYKISILGQGNNFTQMISVVQRMAGLNVTGELDFETKKLFVIPRCGNTGMDDMPQRYEAKPQRTKRSVHFQRYMDIFCEIQRLLIHTVQSHPRYLGRTTMLSKMLSRFAWYVPPSIKCRLKRSSDAHQASNIRVRFVKGSHGDPFPFDGPGGTFGHVFYPDGGKGLPAEVHFDDDETFTTGTGNGINLDWVTVHLFGHTLGLKHSNHQESIMYPWYKGRIPDIELSKDDIQQIRALYGKWTAGETKQQGRPQTPSQLLETANKEIAKVARTAETATTRVVLEA